MAYGEFHRLPVRTSIPHAWSNSFATLVVTGFKSIDFMTTALDLLPSTPLRTASCPPSTPNMKTTLHALLPHQWQSTSYFGPILGLVCELEWKFRIPTDASLPFLEGCHTELLLNNFGMTQLSPPFSAKILSGGKKWSNLCNTIY